MPDDIMAETASTEAPPPTSLSFDYSNGDESSSSQPNQSTQQNNQPNQQKTNETSIVPYTPTASELNPLSRKMVNLILESEKKSIQEEA